MCKQTLRNWKHIWIYISPVQHSVAHQEVLNMKHQACFSDSK